MRNRKSLIVFILQICVGLGLLSQLHAQTNLASITGTITDKAGATISNCKVIVTSKATGASRSPQARMGSIRFLRCPWGHTQLRHPLPGLRRQRRLLS